jgi:5-methyltetrahydrofolate--homocysteine methyltransferase
MAQGLDSAIIDPTDRELMAGLVTAETILDRDKFCVGYITAYRQGKLS